MDGGSGRAGLEVDGLRRCFGDVVALDGLSLAVKRGRILGFLGPNGAGKTTTMRCVAGVVRPDAGEIHWLGRPLEPLEQRRIGYMPEERGLYPRMRVAEQVAYFGRLHGLDRTAAAASAARWLDRLGLSERAGARVEELSHGNQQRVQLAVALVHEPDLLLLDEPFAGLDPVGVDALAAVLREVADRGATVVFSSHQLDLVEQFCDAVAIVARGRLAAAGTLAELRGRGRPRLRVGVAAAAPGWVEALRGVELLERDGEQALLELGPGVDAQDVLAAAQRAGTLTHFSRELPHLSEVFREAVQG